MLAQLPSLGLLCKQLPSNPLKRGGRTNSYSAAAASATALLFGLTLADIEPAAANTGDMGLERCLGDIAGQAVSRGVPQTAVDQALASIRPLPRVLELENRQPEFTLSFGRYLERLVTEERIEQGRVMLSRHGPLLQQISARYSVQSRFLVAFWALETNFGQNLGSFRTLDALATLACQGRRKDFFSTQLVEALQIVGRGEIAADAMVGSWAGALGHVQFIPSTYQAYAVDHDGDGRRDLWGSLPDAFASAANYLSQLGWNDEQTWGREVRLPANFDWRLVSIETKPETEKSLSEWTRLGVTRADGSPLPRVDIEGAVIAPAGHRGPAFLVYRNYHRILDWNRSILYAVAVGHLSDRLIGRPSLVRQVDPTHGRLSLGEVEEIQMRLGTLGFAAGKPDGRIGPLTRAAIRRFQQAKGLPADGFADRTLLRALRESTQG